jgi:glutaredoxin
MNSFAKVFLVVCLAVGGYKLFGHWIDQQVLAAEQGPNDEVIMYALTTCTFCKAKAKEFEANHIRYTEYHLDLDRKLSDEVSEKLTRAGIPGGAVGTPIIEVNGVLLPNNPSLVEIKRHSSGGMPVAIENRSEANSPHRRFQPAFLGFVFARERLLTVVKVCSSSFLSPSQNSNFHSPSTSS